MSEAGGMVQHPERFTITQPFWMFYVAAILNDFTMQATSPLRWGRFVAVAVDQCEMANWTFEQRNDWWSLNTETKKQQPQCSCCSELVWHVVNHVYVVIRPINMSNIRARRIGSITSTVDVGDESWWNFQIDHSCRTFLCFIVWKMSVSASRGWLSTFFFSCRTDSGVLQISACLRRVWSECEAKQVTYGVV